MKKKKPTPLIRLTESTDGRRKIHISRSFLEQVVKEELAEALREADEDGQEEEPAPKKGKKAPSVDDASKTGRSGKGSRKTAADVAPAGSKVRPDPVANPDDSLGMDDGQEVSDEEDPADDEIESDVSDEEGEGDEKLSDELVGKTIQSVTMEPKSKLVPGAQELVITFNEIADPLKVIITKSGEVRFFFRGGLHNLI